MDRKPAVRREIRRAHSKTARSSAVRNVSASSSITTRKPSKVELARYKRSAATIKPPFVDMFFAEPSPGIIATTMLNAHYATYEAYLDAIAREMHYEYKSVVDAGLVLQIDAPDLAMERVAAVPGQDRRRIRQDRRTAHRNAQQGVAGHSGRSRPPPHLLGQLEGPHNYDIGLEPLLRALYAANVGALSIEFANARRQHEYAALKKHRFPDNKI